MRTLIVSLLLGLAAFAQSVPPKESPTPVAVIPFELIGDHLYAQATLNDSFLLSAMIDSGSPDSIFDNSLAIKFGLPSSGNMLMSGLGNETLTSGQKVELNSLSMYGARLNKVAADSISLGSFSQLIGRETDLVIGSSDLFSKYVVELNYIRREVRLYDPDTYIESREGCRLPLLVDLYPIIHIQLVDNDEKLIDAAFVLDTGSNYLVVTKLFGDAHPSLSLDGKTIEAAPRKFVSGLTPFRAGRIRAIRLGDCIVEQPLAAFLQGGVSLGAAKQQFSGTIGINILRNFTTIVDYRHGTVTFIRSNTTPVVPQYDMTGIHVLASDPSFHKFTVDFVLSESPAARCGIRVGDTIDSVNHMPASQLTVNDLYEMFKRQGSLRLTISRNGVRLKKKLKLKPLI